ncbi:lysozyme [Parvularcula sp. LCG005]|uniref:lysozyme n=1 Tax=Parvularcula sp. LCG005 TaxID=3078805 RepID=UPI0029423355|nr:glycoside hydrolase family protein [Parvularcula sp. LCG005]WOI52533.1 glycoside hydrolase family protein [Parvularcula sp. LCG005]
MAGISAEGIALIKRWEGLRLDSYQDIAGIWTIGYGHTGREVGPDQTITEAEAEDLLREDVRRFENGVNDLVKVPLTQSMFDALVSFSYNVGTGALKSSTALKRLNKEDYTGAAEALTWWNKARDPQSGQLVVSNGLARRRQSEAALFLRDIDELEGDDAAGDTMQGAEIKENPPRRSNPVTTRTTGGAVTAGTAGAAGAGAILMDDEDGSKSADQTDGTSTDGTTTGNDSGSTTTDGTTDQSSDDVVVQPGEDEEGWPEEWSDGSTDASDGTADDGTSDDWTGDTGDGTASGDEKTDQPDSGDTGEDTSTGTDTADSADDGGQTATGTEQPTPGADQTFEKKDYTDAFVVACGVLAVLAAIYVIGARIDDWRKYRR